MSEPYKRNTGISFGKLFLGFLMLLLLALSFISFQTSDKLKNENQKAIEQFLSSQLDEIVSKCFLHEYVKDSVDSIIELAKKEGPDSQNLKAAMAKKEPYMSRPQPM